MTIDEKAKAMARLVFEIEDVERAKRESAKEFRDQLTRLFSELETIAGDVQTGQRRIDDVTDGSPAGRVTQELDRAAAAIAGGPADFASIPTPLLESLRNMCPKSADAPGISLKTNDGPLRKFTFAMRKAIDQELKARKAGARKEPTQ